MPETWPGRITLLALLASFAAFALTLSPDIFGDHWRCSLLDGDCVRGGGAVDAIFELIVVIAFVATFALPLFLLLTVLTGFMCLVRRKW